MNKTITPSIETIERNWFLVDAKDKTLGRLATEIATVLRGKNKPTFTPHLDTGDFVIVVNAEKVEVTGKKASQKLYRRHSGRPGGMKIEKFELPICSIILDERGRCIGRGVNRRNINKDPLGHAEIMALRQASLIKNDWRFNECTIITNLEPCTMCSSALIQARMGKVIFGAYDKKRGGLGGSIDLSKHESAHHKMEIIGGILEDECIHILQIWFKKLRTQK